VEPDDEPPPSSNVDSDPPPAAKRLLDPGASGGRLLIALACGAMATLVTSTAMPFRVRAVVGWDTGALVLTVLAWIMIFRSSPESTRARAALDDPGARLVFVLAIVSSVFSLFAAVVVLREIKTLPPAKVPIWTGLALAAVVLSWFVTHTAFTFRYAHLYYRRRVTTTHCMVFPGTDAPSELDFAYFAFTLGMCFQVSDVVVQTSRARRAVLFHALVSFVFNTTILALSLNLVTTMLG
jgi:uncharacterized membrane protein